uniref:fructose-bisphosphatase n=1 Tax=Triticum urartu TaxID=4572 RepID=A0A8R7TYP2_TRIUA
MDHAADTFRTDLMTITRHVLNEQSRHPESRGDLTILLSHIVLGCKFVASAVNKAGLAKLTGLAGETNVQGEEQKKLDVLSNEVFVNALVSSGRTCVLVSEEDEKATFVDPKLRGKYCVCFDPLDGSSNIDCGVSIGTVREAHKKFHQTQKVVRNTHNYGKSHFTFLFALSKSQPRREYAHRNMLHGQFISYSYMDFLALQIFGIYMIKNQDTVTLEEVLQPG